MYLLLLIALVKTFVWNAVTTNADGTPCMDLERYEISHGNVSGVYTKTIPVGNVTEAQVNLSPGKHYLIVRAVDFSGNKSAPSNETFYEVLADPSTYPKLTVATVTGTATSVDLGITFSVGTDPGPIDDVSALQFDLILPSPVTYGGTITAGAAAAAAGKSATANVLGDKIRILVFGINQNLIGNGVVAIVRLNISATGRQEIGITGLALSTPDGTNVPGTGIEGAVTVTLSTPTPTPTRTPTPAPTFTPTPAPSQTPLPTATPTRTPTPQQTPTPRPSPTPHCSTVQECTAIINKQRGDLASLTNTYKNQVNLTAKYLRERNDCVENCNK